MIVATTIITCWIFGAIILTAYFVELPFVLVLILFYNVQPNESTRYQRKFGLLIFSGINQSIVMFLLVPTVTIYFRNLTLIANLRDLEWTGGTVLFGLFLFWVWGLLISRIFYFNDFLFFSFWAGLVYFIFARSLSVFSNHLADQHFEEFIFVIYLSCSIFLPVVS